MAASVSEALINESAQESPNLATNHRIDDTNPKSGEEGDATAAAPEEEEERECGFCLFMKGGGCKDSFVAWEKCVEEAEKKNEDVVSKCVEAAVLLKKVAEEEAVKLEKEAGGASVESGAGSSEVAKQTG